MQEQMKAEISTLKDQLASISEVILKLQKTIEDKATRNYLKSPHAYAAKPFHPFPYPRRLPLYLVITSLLLAMAHHLLVSADADPLVRGATAVHRITSLQSAATLFLFLLLAFALLIADASPALLFPSSPLFTLLLLAYSIHFLLPAINPSPVYYVFAFPLLFLSLSLNGFLHFKPGFLSS